MKKTIISILVVLIVAGGGYYLRQQAVPKNEIPVLPEQQSKVTELLQQGTSDTVESEKGMEIAIDNLDGYNYEGGGEYTTYSPQVIKDALATKKDIILYFYANRDPSDKALDIDLQKRKDRIPKNTVIVKIDYDTNPKIREAYAIKQQNTLVWLNDEGIEKTRRSIGITSLSQIVRVQ